MPREKDLSYREFYNKYAKKSLPVILTGSEIDNFLPYALDVANLKRKCGHTRAKFDRISNSSSFGLEPAGETDMSSFLDQELGKDGGGQKSVFAS